MPQESRGFGFAHAVAIGVTILFAGFVRILLDPGWAFVVMALVTTALIGVEVTRRRRRRRT